MTGAEPKGGAGPLCMRGLIGVVKRGARGPAELSLFSPRRAGGYGVELQEWAECFGRFLIVFSGVYALAMAIRYVVRMSRQPDQRWFGGTIPIVFHFVLASYLYVLGSVYAG